jgi:hypothetical protein
MKFADFKEKVERLRDQRDELIGDLEADANDLISAIGAIAFDLDDLMAERRSIRVCEAVESAIQLLREIDWEEIRYCGSVVLPGDPAPIDGNSEILYPPELPGTLSVVPTIREKRTSEIDDDEDFEGETEEIERSAHASILDLLNYLTDEFLPSQLECALKGNRLDLAVPEVVIGRLRSALGLWTRFAGSPPSWVDPVDYLES